MAVGIGQSGDGVQHIGTSWGAKVPITELTFFCKFSVTNGNINNSGLFSMNSLTSGVEARRISCRVQNGTPCKLRISNDASFSNYWEFNINNYSVLTSLVVKWNPLTPTTPQAFVNGAATSITIVGTAPAQTLDLGLILWGWYGGAGTNGFSGIFYDFAMYRSQLSDRQCLSLSTGFVDPKIFNPDVVTRFLNNSPYKNEKDHGVGTYANTYNYRHAPLNYLS